MINLRAFLPLGVLLTTGCDPSGVEAFRQGRGFDPCIATIPACSDKFAGCVLDEANYTETDFPGDFSFVVHAGPEVEIEVMMFFAEQQDAGIETYIYWYEPGCSDVYTFDSGGRDLLEEAVDSVYSETRKVHQGGEHLIYISSDMQVRANIAINLIEPGD